MHSRVTLEPPAEIFNLIMYLKFAKMRTTPKYRRDDEIDNIGKELFDRAQIYPISIILKLVHKSIMIIAVLSRLNLLPDCDTHVNAYERNV